MTIAVVFINLMDLIGVALAVFGLISAILIGVATWLRRMLCSHPETRENSRTLDVICTKCGKNLGFKGLKNRQ